MQGILPMKQSVHFDKPRWGKGFRVICHECYEHSNYSPDGVLPLRCKRRVVQNYKQLTPEKKTSVPISFYHNVRAIQRGENEVHKPYHLTSHSSTLYPRESKSRVPLSAQRAKRILRGLTSGMVGKEDKKIQA